MKKIAFLMASASTGELSGELERREKILRSITGPDTRIDIFGLEKDPERSRLGTIQSSYEASLSTVEDLECAREAEKAGYDAIIIPCTCAASSPQGSVSLPQAAEASSGQ